MKTVRIKNHKLGKCNKGCSVFSLHMMDYIGKSAQIIGATDCTIHYAYELDIDGGTSCWSACMFEIDKPPVFDGGRGKDFTK